MKKSLTVLAIAALFTLVLGINLSLAQPVCPYDKDPYAVVAAPQIAEVNETLLNGNWNVFLKFTMNTRKDNQWVIETDKFATLTAYSAFCPDCKEYHTTWYLDGNSIGWGDIRIINGPGKGHFIVNVGFDIFRMFPPEKIDDDYLAFGFCKGAFEIKTTGTDVKAAGLVCSGGKAYVVDSGYNTIGIGTMEMTMKRPPAPAP